MQYSDDDEHWDEVAARMREEPDPAPRAARHEFGLDEPVVLRGSKLTVNFWGVPANDAYLSVKGIGAPRGPTQNLDRAPAGELARLHDDMVAVDRILQPLWPRSHRRGAAGRAP